MAPQTPEIPARTNDHTDKADRSEQIENARGSSMDEADRGETGGHPIRRGFPIGRPRLAPVGLAGEERA